jgi:hypothetical protein
LITFVIFLFLLTSNLSAELKKMPLAGVNIARALALVEDGRSIRYAANAIGGLGLLLLLVTNSQSC